MIKTSSLKRGSIVDVNGQPHVVESVQTQTPSARGASSLYKIRFRNLVTRQKVDRSLKGDDAFEDVDVDRRDVQYSYKQGDTYTFTDLEDYSEIAVAAADVAEQSQYLTEDLEGIRLLMSEGKVLAIELPDVVELPIEQCDPSIKGASATARTKPATLCTGLVVQVPEYMSPDETVRVDTSTGKFLSRA